MRLTLEPPAGFSFKRTVCSHGWSTLAPFRLDNDRGTLSAAVAAPDGTALSYRLSVRDGRVVIDSPGPGDAVKRRLLRDTARRVLNLDLDLSEFHEAARRVDGMEWIAASGAGRLMRAATTFEDLIKLVLTTNCTWAFTTKMVDRLVERYGAVAPDGSRAFPTAQALARVGARALRERCRTGYRAPALAKLARDVHRGRLDPAGWERDGREPRELREDLLQLPGVGPYVAENLLRLFGRPAGLGLDSAVRSWYARVYHGGRPVRDRTIARRYARLGRWAGLAVWCEMTRAWLDEVEPE
jgi:3-methyladenine DNA glycosylase/8-oxoguanine DNA glycosylase